MADAESQLALAQRMKDAVVALKGGGIERRTEANLEKGLREIEQLWQLFENGHQQLQIDPNHAYYTSNV